MTNRIYKFFYEASLEKTLLVVIIALIFYAYIDILIWQRIFESDNMISYAGVYSKGFITVLISEVIIGSLLLCGNIKEMIFYASTLTLFGLNGTEDILYYFLDGKMLPNNLPWLDHSHFIFFKPVTKEGLIGNVIVWGLIWALMWISISIMGEYRIHNNKKIK